MTEGEAAGVVDEPAAVGAWPDGEPWSVAPGAAFGSCNSPSGLCMNTNETSENFMGIPLAVDIGDGHSDRKIGL